jgi:hypothetical protein
LDSYLVDIQSNLQYLVEPLLAPLLFLFYWLNSSSPKRLVLFAFLFLWMGDLLILFEEGISFLKWGIFSYWIMQLLLIKYFIDNYKIYNFGAHLMGILFYSSYLTIFLSHVYQTLGSMRIHGVVYGLTVSALGSLMIMELLSRQGKVIILMTLGLFVFSVRDILITYNKCYFNEDFFTYPIPLLHALGFFMMVKSFIWLEENKKNEKS